MSVEAFREGRRQTLWTASRAVDDGGGTVGGQVTGASRSDHAESARPSGSGRADQAEAAAALVDPEVPLEDAAVLAGAGVLDELEESLEDAAESDDVELDSEDLPFVLARLSLR
jgi:hypothetical protein